MADASATGINRIDHFFVLMLENRSFDHLLGYSGIEGVDVRTGMRRPIDGLAGKSFANPLSDGTLVRPTRGGARVTSPDPAHELVDVEAQLCSRGWFSSIDNQGFATSYQKSRNGDPRQVMACFAPEELPILTTLAREFAVCDRWFSSLPGPTWPNRFFVHAGTCGGLDVSPGVGAVLGSQTLEGYEFTGGHIYQQLMKAGKRFRVYSGDSFPQVLAIDQLNSLGQNFGPAADPTDEPLRTLCLYETFGEDLMSPDYDVSYTFIEPDYGNLLDGYTNGNSQHPCSDIADGEALIKDVYETLRASPHWSSSALIIVYDEHGGFYDHVPPPPALPTGDDVRYNRLGFKFDRLGPRVPAVVISPFVKKGSLDGATFDHTSILKTLESRFGLPGMTDRDRNATSLEPLFLGPLRADAPLKLPEVNRTVPQSLPSVAAVPAAAVIPDHQTWQQVQLASLAHARVAPGESVVAKLAAHGVRSRDDARAYIDYVNQKIDKGA